MDSGQLPEFEKVSGVLLNGTWNRLCHEGQLLNDHSNVMRNLAMCTAARKKYTCITYCGTIQTYAFERYESEDTTC